MYAHVDGLRSILHAHDEEIAHQHRAEAGPRNESGDAQTHAEQAMDLVGEVPP